MSDWLRSRWPWLAGIGAAFLAGWLARPVRVEVRERVVERVVHASEHQEQATGTAQQTAQVDTSARAEQHRRVVTRRVVHTLPTGERTVTTDRTEEEGLLVEVGQAVRVELALSGAVSSAAREVQVHQLEREREERPALPTWRAQGLVGFDWRTGGTVYGGQVSRRVLGPLWAGAWALSSGAGGVGVAGEW